MEGLTAPVRALGTDLVDIDRLRRSLARTPRLLDRLFTAQERAYAEQRRDPTERYAGRFAVKEATMKALGVGLGSVGFHDIEVRRSPSGRPSIELHGRADTLATEHGIDRWLVTISHTDHVASAVVIGQ